MSVFLHSYTKALKRYDSDLFAERTRDGAACVFRKIKRFVPVCEGEGFRLLNLQEDKQFVFALTDTWTLSGTPRDWGIDDVVGRIQQLDSWAHKDLLERLDAENEKVDESNKRSMKNEMEAFWSHEHSRFKKATGDVLTHSLSKVETRKRLKDRSIKNGNN